MKLKTWHLFLVIIILFGCSFYVVNLHFDKFYRLNGINNDNRVLIEKYLSDDEQEYLRNWKFFSYTIRLSLSSTSF